MLILGLAIALLIIFAYLCGSIPTGYLLGRYLKGIDIREYGSGSIGATNVLRTLGKGPGLIVLLVDLLKGMAAISLVYIYYTIPSTPFFPSDWQPWLVTLAGLTAIVGHSKSVWLNFSGGKSVATSLGVLLMMSPLVGLGTLGAFLVMLAVSRIVSLSSITGAIAVSILMLVCHQPLAYILFGFCAGIYVIWRHRSNIERLLAGKEPQLGQKSAQDLPNS